MPDEMPTLGTVDLGDGRTATHISAGGAHTCAILDNGKLKCWGCNGYGQLGYSPGNNGCAAWPNDNIYTSCKGDAAGEMAALGTVDLGTDRTAVAVTCGASHTCGR